MLRSPRRGGVLQRLAVAVLRDGGGEVVGDVAGDQRRRPRHHRLRGDRRRASRRSAPAVGRPAAGVSPVELAVVGDDPELEVPMAHAGGAFAVAVHTGIGHAGSFTDLPGRGAPAPGPARRGGAGPVDPGLRSRAWTGLRTGTTAIDCRSELRRRRCPHVNQQRWLRSPRRRGRRRRIARGTGCSSARSWPGAYISFGALVAITVSSGLDPSTWGTLPTLFMGAAFTLGLVLVLIAGSDLATGNMMLVPLGAMRGQDHRRRRRRRTSRWCCWATCSGRCSSRSSSPCRRR